MVDGTPSSDTLLSVVYQVPGAPWFISSGELPCNRFIDTVVAIMIAKLIITPTSGCGGCGGNDAAG
jgi:hypothetical protein